jgi:hypothetical protein|tara:strand:+ start:918 stop:1292 length:375 start_codon:yes stop_codon:yes gene_type:complete
MTKKSRARARVTNNTYIHTHIEKKILTKKNFEKNALGEAAIEANAIPSVLASRGMYEDFNRAVMGLLEDECPRDFEDTISSACEIAGVRYKTGRYEYVKTCTSSRGDFIVYPLQGKQVIDFRGK